MSVINSTCTPLIEPRWPVTPVVEPQWYAVHTRSQHEKAVVHQLERNGIETFLPLISEVHRWSDRRKIVQLPLFSCYAFVHMRLLPDLWYKVTQTSGVLGFVGPRREGVPIPESQIEGMKKLLSSNLPYTLCPFLRVGQRVRIRGGALDGIEGIFLSRQGQHTLVISVDGIQKSLAVSIPGYDIESL